MIAWQMATATALPGFNDLGHSVTSIFSLDELLFSSTKLVIPHFFDVLKQVTYYLTALKISKNLSTGKWLRGRLQGRSNGCASRYMI